MNEFKVMDQTEQDVLLFLFDRYNPDKGGRYANDVPRRELVEHVFGGDGRQAGKVFRSLIKRGFLLGKQYEGWDRRNYVDRGTGASIKFLCLGQRGLDMMVD